MTLTQMLGQKLVFGFHGTSLSPEFKALIRKYKIGNVILFLRNVESADQQLRALKKCIKKGLSVRQAEELSRSLAEAPAAAAQPTEDEEYPDSYLRLVEQLEKFFSQEISIKRAKNGGGKIVIGFDDDKDIERFIERFAKRS